MMLGLYLTYNCNQHCPYCFKKHVPDKRITDEDFYKFCMWVYENRPASVYIAGGEPTTHPDFVHFMKTLRWVGRRPVQIISNLICSPSQLEGFDYADALVNTSPPHTGEERRVFEANLEQLVARPGTRVTLSHTLYDLDQETDHIVMYCEAFGITHVRLDFARASLLRNNKHLTLDAIAPYKDKLVALGKQLVDKQILVGLDCPIPKGIFSQDELQVLRFERAPLVDADTFLCTMVYINPDLTISSCPFRVIDERRLDTFPNMGTLFATVQIAMRRKMAKGKEGPFLCMAERFM